MRDYAGFWEKCWVNLTQNGCCWHSCQVGHQEPAGSWAWNGPEFLKSSQMGLKESGPKWHKMAKWTKWRQIGLKHGFAESTVECVALFCWCRYLPAGFLKTPEGSWSAKKGAGWKGVGVLRLAGGSGQLLGQTQSTPQKKSKTAKSSWVGLLEAVKP